jgi:DNA polymerase III alpha subunit (gram-positive type)
MPFLFLDTETTGLDPYTQDITEIGCIMIDNVNGKFKVNAKKVFHKRIKIQNEDTAQEEALEVGHYIESLWNKTGVEAEEGLKEWNDWLREMSPGNKPIICAQNAEFDKSFVFSNCDRYHVFPFVDNAWIDLIAIWAVYKVMNGLEHLNNSNAAICKHFGVENVKAHAALSDAVASAQCFCEILNKLEFKS